jgi:hypothetical protein
MSLKRPWEIFVRGEVQISSRYPVFLTADTDFQSDGMAHFKIGKNIAVCSGFNFRNLLLGDMRGFGDFFLAEAGIFTGFLELKRNIQKFFFFFEVFPKGIVF